MFEKVPAFLRATDRGMSVAEIVCHFGFEEPTAVFSIASHTHKLNTHQEKQKKRKNRFMAHFFPDAPLKWCSCVAMLFTALGARLIGKQ